MKRPRFSHDLDPFDGLPDDLVICVLSKLSSSSACPSDFISALMVCKRFNRLGLNQLVLARAGSGLFAVPPRSWSESAHLFIKHCVNAGSTEACYFLGMVQFYCLHNRGIGASLMAKAAIRSHAQALYSLAVIQFNGSGGSKTDKDLRAGIALCARAAYLGHIDALRELGHCLQDGYGVKQNISQGRRIIVHANARELTLAFPSAMPSSICPCFFSTNRHRRRFCGLWSDYGCSVPGQEPHPVNRFLVGWFALKREGLGADRRMCSHSGCGRPETRAHEFRRCSVCGAANYCSRSCQARDWKLRHKDICAPTEGWPNELGEGGAGGDGGLVVGQVQNEPS